MAQIVQIAVGTLRPNNQLGDVVEVQEDNVELSPAYNTFTVQQAEGLTKEEVTTIFEAKIPEPRDGLKKYPISLILTGLERANLANASIPKSVKLILLDKAIYD